MGGDQFDSGDVVDQFYLLYDLVAVENVDVFGVGLGQDRVVVVEAAYGFELMVEG